MSWDTANSVGGPELSLVIVAFHSQPYLVKALESAYTTLATTWALEVIVIDNGGSSSDQEDVAAWASARGIEITWHSAACNQGYCAGVNVGLSLARSAHWVFVINPDAVVLSATRDALAAVWSDPAALVYLPIRQGPERRHVLGIGLGPGLHFRTVRPEEALHGAGAAFMISRSAVEAGLRLDERLIMFQDESQLALTALRRGLDVVLMRGDAAIEHLGHHSYDGRAVDKMVLYDINALRVALTHLSTAGLTARIRRTATQTVRRALDQGLVFDRTSAAATARHGLRFFIDLPRLLVQRRALGPPFNPGRPNLPGRTRIIPFTSHSS